MYEKFLVTYRGVPVPEEVYGWSKDSVCESWCQGVDSVLDTAPQDVDAPEPHDNWCKGCGSTETHRKRCTSCYWQHSCICSQGDI